MLFALLAREGRVPLAILVEDRSRPVLILLPA